MSKQNSFERPSYVIVGGGASGLVLSLRLLQAGSNVTLVERGTEFADTKIDSLDPLDWGFAALGRNYNSKDECEGTRHLTASQSSMGERQMRYPQGCGLGGSTNMNCCIWTAGHRGVFDAHWPPQWNSDIMNEYLISVASILMPSTAHASDGMAQSILKRTRCSVDDAKAARNPQSHTRSVESLLWTSLTRTSSYLTTASSSSSKNDYVSSSSRRSSRLQDLLRAHGSTASGGKLLLHCEAEAEFLVLDGTTAVGVQIRLHTGSTLLLKPVGCGEIILCCGAFETPRLLIASGLKGQSLRSTACSQYYQNAEMEAKKEAREQGLRDGRPQQARATDKSGGLRKAASLSCTLDGPPTLLGIGTNFQDHVVLPLICIGNWWSVTKFDSTLTHKATKTETRSWFRFSIDVIKWTLALPFTSLRLSSLTLPPNGVHGWIDLDANGMVFASGITDDSSPSAMLILIDGRMSPGVIAEMILPRLSKPLIYVKYIRPILYFLLQFLLQWSFVKWLCSFVFGFLVCLTKPRSRGMLANPLVDFHDLQKQSNEPLVADPNYLSDEKDAAILRAATATAHAILEEARQHSGLWYLELLPGLPFSYARASDYFNFYAKLFGVPFYHASGTCAMGVAVGEAAVTATATATACAVPSSCAEAATHHPSASTSNRASSDNSHSVIGCDDDADNERISLSPAHDSNDSISNMPTVTAAPIQSKRLQRDGLAVVDNELRVRGISGLRIADASVFPHIPSGPISAVCMAVGEGASRLLLKDQLKERAALAL